MKEIFKKEYSSKSLILVGLTIYLLYEIFGDFFGGTFKIILDTLGSMGTIILIWGVGQIYISKKFTDSKIISFSLGIVTFVAVVLIFKWLFSLIVG